MRAATTHARAAVRWILPVLAPALLAACGSAPKAPFAVDGGSGSEYGNYGMVPTGETVVIGGAPCTVWEWDRPISAKRVLRERSASCPAPDNSGRMVATGLERRIVPMSESHLAEDLTTDAESQAGSSTESKKP
jgi:hypothetical protein